MDKGCIAARKNTQIPYDMVELCNQVMKGTLFGLNQVDIYVPDELIDKLSNFCLLFGKTQDKLQSCKEKLNSVSWT